MPRTRNVHPDVAAWEAARVAAGVAPTSAATAGKQIMSMARSLAVEPAQLPADAASIHFRGRECSARTVKLYHANLTSFRRFVSGTGARPVRLSGAEEFTDPDILRWYTRLERTKSPNTAKRYCQNLATIVKSLPDVEYARDLTEDDIFDHLAAADEINFRRKGYPLRANTIKAKFTALGEFFRFMKLPDLTEAIREEFELDGRDENNTVPVPQETLRYLLDCASMDALSADPRRAAEGKRARTLMLLGSTQGYRIHESNGTGRDHLVWRDGVAYLELEQFKRGRRQPSLYVRASAQVVADLMEHYKPGERVTPADWTPKAAGDFLEGFSLRHGARTCSHQYRARFASTLYRESGGNLIAVKTYMRHRNVTTTQRYITIESDDPVHDIAHNIGASWTATAPKPVDAPIVPGARRTDLIPLPIPHMA